MLLAGCAGFGGYGIQPGTPRDAVIAQMGQPTRVCRCRRGERLQYGAQPYGRETWMVDLDASGRVVQARQVLTDGNFHRIEAGKWTRDDVEREFGRPAWIDSVTSWSGPVMTYRWRDTAQQPHVLLGLSGRAQRRAARSPRHGVHQRAEQHRAD